MKKNRTKCPPGLGYDKEGNPCQDPAKIKKLSPLGGQEDTAGYKGYGLSIMVDCLTGLLSGAKYGPFIRKLHENTFGPNLGQCYICINPDMFDTEFRCSMYNTINHLRHMPCAGTDYY